MTLTSKVHEMGKQYNYYYHIFIIISSVFLYSQRIYTSKPSMQVLPEIENLSKKALHGIVSRMHYITENDFFLNSFENIQPEIRN